MEVHDLTEKELKALDNAVSTNGRKLWANRYQNQDFKVTP